jgi:TonB-dependent starch-binding outer membrane protein SusC
MKKISLVLTMVLFAFSFALAQRSISGTVTDTKGEALIGASVLAKGTSTGTVTDVDGKYAITVPSGNNTLVFTFVGYETMEVNIGSSNVLDVKMAEDAKLLASVVIVETGTGVATDKRKVATDVQVIGARALPAVSTASLDQALVGKVAGAQISSVNGTPGAKASILLRGINTINRSTTPMILMDGVEMGATDLNSIDLNAVERVEVIQGAAAASFYGAQGANGVLQLFSKKGKAGTMNIDFSSSYTQSDYLNIGGVRKADMHSFNTNANGEVVNGTTVLAIDPVTGMYNANIAYPSAAGPLDPTLQVNKPYGKNLKYYDHFAMFFQTAPTTNNSLRISGGKDNFDYSIIGSHNYQQSNLLGNGDYNRSNFSANFGAELFKGLKFRSITQVAYTKSSINDGGGNATIYSAFNTRPFVDYTYKTADGNYTIYQGAPAGPNGQNPFFINQYSSTSEQKLDVLQSVNLNYQPTKWLEFDAKYGVNYRSEENYYVYQNQSKNVNVQNTDYWWYNFNDGDATGEINNNQYRTTMKHFLTGAILRFDLGKNIKSSTYVGFDYRNRLYKQYRTYGLGVPTYTPFTMQQTAAPKLYQDDKTPFVTYGYLLSQHFDIGEWAGVTAGIRSDYSSAFGGGSKPFTFPRGDAFVRLSELGFWKNNAALSNLIPEIKIRAAYGEAGIQPKPFDRYITLSTKNIGGNNAFYFGSKQSNPNLDVEVSKELEFGGDIVFKTSKGDWLNSVTFSPTYWTRTTDNAIWDVDFVPSSGIGTYKDNVFTLASHGTQFSLGIQIADKKDFSWRLTTNFGRQTSEITKGAAQPVVLTTAAGSTNYVLTDGVKIGQLFGYLGLHSVSEKDAKGVPYIPEASQSLYEVASNGWVVDKASKQPYFTPNQYPLGDPNPAFNMSFINTLTYKEVITLNFQFDWLSGSHLYNQTKEWMYRDGIHSDYQQPFTVGGQTGAWSAFYRGVYAVRARNGTKSYFYEDASFVRLRNVSVVIDAKKLLNINVARKLDVVLSGRNLITWTKYTGMDPEANSSNIYKDGDNSAWDRGTDHNTMPNLRSYTIGLNVGF